MTIKITTDSTCDLPAEILEQRNISVAPLGITKAGKLYRDGDNISIWDIAAHVDSGGEITTTSAVNIGDYEALFAPLSKQYDAVIHINIGIGFSWPRPPVKVPRVIYRYAFVIDQKGTAAVRGMKRVYHHLISCTVRYFRILARRKKRNFGIFHSHPVLISLTCPFYLVCKKIFHMTIMFLKFKYLRIKVVRMAVTHKNKNVFSPVKPGNCPIIIVKNKVAVRKLSDKTAVPNIGNFNIHIISP